MPEDRERINALLSELSDLVQEVSLRPDMAHEFDHWAETVFGPITGYGNQDDEEILVPKVFRDAWSDDT